MGDDEEKLFSTMTITKTAKLSRRLCYLTLRWTRSLEDPVKVEEVTSTKRGITQSMFGCIQRERMHLKKRTTWHELI